MWPISWRTYAKALPSGFILSLWQQEKTSTTQKFASSFEKLKKTKTEAYTNQWALSNPLYIFNLNHYVANIFILLQNEMKTYFKY